MKQTSHAHVRAQQRCIPPLVMKWLLEYGTRSPSYGAIKVQFDKRGKRALAQEVGQPIVKQLSRYLNTSLVVDPSDDTVITVMWNH